MGVLISEPVIVVSTFDGSNPNFSALVSFDESVGNENCDAEIVFPADMYKFIPGSKVSALFPPTFPVPIVKVEGEEFVAKVYVEALLKL